MKEIDEYVHMACSTLTTAISFRKIYLAKPREEWGWLDVGAMAALPPGAAVV